MKRYLWILAAAIAMVACDNKETPTDPTSELTVSPTSLSFTESDSSTKFLQVNTSGSWTATPSADWIKLSTTSGSGSGSLSVSVAANEGGARTGAVDFAAGSLKASVSVAQSGSNWVTLVANPDSFDGIKRSNTAYQLLIYSFADSDGDGIGDFKGIQNKLDYLDKMGVTALWLSPAHPTSSYHAYDVNDYYALNPLYAVGEHTTAKAEADFKDLLAAAHEKGIAIYMDYVLNHSGTGIEWFKSVKADPYNSPYKDYYVLSNGDYPSDAIGGMGGWVSLGGGNIGYQGRLHFKVDWTGVVKYVTVTETTEDVTPPNTTNAKVWIHVGSKGSLGMHETSTNIFELTLDVDTDWGFLVRSSNDESWPSGTKYGGKPGKNVISMGVAFVLDNSTSATDIVFGESVSYYASFDSSMPDLNYGNSENCQESPAFKATVESAKKWVDMDVDGFRLDAVIWVYQKNLKSNQRFLSKWYDAVNERYKEIHSGDNIFMVGEAWADGGHSNEKQYYVGLPSCFEFDYGYYLKDVLNNQKAGSFATDVAHYISDHTAVRPDAITSFFLSNHDQDRFGSNVGKNINRMKQAGAILLSGGGKPFIYQGEELGYYGTKGSGDEYVRTPIMWDKAGRDCAKKGVNNKVDTGMLKADISVEAQSATEGSILQVYETWSRLRNTYEALASGTMTDAKLTGSSIASWYMTAGDEKLLVIHNVASSEKQVTVTDDMSHPVAVLGAATVNQTALKLGANSSVVFQL